MEKSNKRRYTLMVISFLFLLVATFVTVYNFKNTRAEETDAVVNPSIKIATCKGASNFVFRSDGISGCEMTIDTLKNISGFQQYLEGYNWEEIRSFTLDTEYGIKRTDKLFNRYKSKHGSSYSEPWSYDYYNLYSYNISIESSTICQRETFCCNFKLQDINSDKSQRFRNTGNFHMILVPDQIYDSFEGEFVYAFPSTDIGPASPLVLAIDYYGYENECKYAYNQPLVKVTIDDRRSTSTEYYQVSDMKLERVGGTDSITSTVHYTGGNVYIKYTPPTREGYVFDGFKLNDVKDIAPSSNNYYKLPITHDETAVQDTTLQKTYKMIERKLTVKWKELPSPTPSTTVTFDFNAPDNVSSGKCTCEDSVLDKICLAFNSNPTDENFEYVVSAGSSIQLPTIRCPGINKKIKYWSGKTGNFTGNFKPTEDTTLVANWVPINSGSVKYEVVLKKNCSGTFVCSSTTNSEVCTQLKNNGKFTKTVTKGDTIIIPKTFDSLTCDGKKISSWGSYSLGTTITVNNNIYLDAVWESSNGGGDTPDPGQNDDPINNDPGQNDDPINNDPGQNDDPINNPQTGSIVIYLVLLFGIGALVYSVWYFRGFREN